MKLSHIYSILRVCIIALALVTFTSCQNKNSKKTSSLTGWTSSDKKSSGFSVADDFKGSQTPPGMVLIEGGSFTM